MEWHAIAGLTGTRAGVPDPAFESEYLVRFAAGLTRARYFLDEELSEADWHRRRAQQLVDTEQAYCRNVRPEDLDRSPLEDRTKIQEVTPVVDPGHGTRGVRILLRPDAGVTAAQVSELIGCHGARYVALGKPMTYLGGDPTIVDGVRVTIGETRGQVEVVVESEDRASALAALGRAQDLVSPYPQNVPEPEQTARR